MRTARARATLLLVVIVTLSLLAAAWVAAQPLSSGGVPAPQAGVSWRTWVNDVVWTSGMQITAETSDTLKVVNVLTTLPSEAIRLVETWEPGRLKLLDVQVAPGVYGLKRAS